MSKPKKSYRRLEDVIVEYMTVDMAVSAVRKWVLEQMPKRKRCYKCSYSTRQCDCRIYNDAIDEMEKRMGGA